MNTLRAGALGAVLLSTAGAGCAELNAIRASVAPSQQAVFYPGASAERAPTTPEQVRVYQPTQKLPPGFRRKEQVVKVEENFPNDSAPSVILGGVRVNADRGAEGNDLAMVALLVAEAAKHGANGLVLPNCDARRMGCTATAIWVSDAQPEGDYDPAPKLLAAMGRQKSAPENAVREDRKGRLESDAMVRISAKRGTCYAFNLALEKDAQLSADAREHLWIDVRFDAELMISTTLGASVARRQRAFSSSVGCPQQDGPIEIVLSAKTLGATGPLGNGPYVMALYTWPIEESALDRRKQNREEQKVRNAQAAKGRCDDCKNKLYTCIENKKLACTRVYADCLERQGMRLKDCDR